MKVSRAWLQRFFDAPLPDTEALRDAFTFHAFEVEEAEGDLLDIKVLPDRAGYALSHRGIAYELSAILGTPMKADPLKDPIPGWKETDTLIVTADPAYVLRHTGALVRGIKVGPSPQWLKGALESVGQRSINNVVDASNFVMLNIGQPTHAFDANKIASKGDVVDIHIREAKNGEKVLLLSGEEKELDAGIYVFSGGPNGTPLDIAGVKGGLDSGVSDATTDIFISVGNYDGLLLRKAAQRLHVFTDASQRFQNRPSAELTAYGMRDLLALIKEVAGGEVVGVIDIYPQKATQKSVSVTEGAMKEVLGANFGEKEIEEAFTRLGFQYAKDGTTYTVTPPWERSDIVVPEDLIEEVGRIIGYDKVLPEMLPPRTDIPVNALWYWGDKLRTRLVTDDFSEVLTSVFTSDKGERQVSNKVDADAPYLRKSVIPSLTQSLKMNLLNRPLLGLTEVKLFEIGKVFLKTNEAWRLGVAIGPDKKKAKAVFEALFTEFGASVPITEKEGVAEIDFEAWVAKLPKGESYETLPAEPEVNYKPFSRYPFVDRDIAVWTPEGTSAEVVEKLIREKAGDLVVRLGLFDTFTKDARTSYAFRLVFQSNERTLSDDEVNGYMQAVYDAMKAQSGWEVR